MHYAWLIWSLFLMGAWLFLFLLLQNGAERRKMLVVSALTSLLGFTEPLFVPEYWSPPSLFDLALRTGFDIESLLFSFGIGGIAVVLYDGLIRSRTRRIAPHERHAPRHRMHLWALLAAPIAFLLLLPMPLNPIYAAILAMTIGGLATIACRTDLTQRMLVGSALFLGLYILYFFTLIAAYPGYVEQVWNLKALSGILVLGIPLEELLFAASFGFFWSGIYAHLTWRADIHRHALWR